MYYELPILHIKQTNEDKLQLHHVKRQLCEFLQIFTYNYPLSPSKDKVILAAA
jgi:hypothetical protein